MGMSAHRYSKLLSGLILASTLMAVGCSDGGKKTTSSSASSSSSSSSSSSTSSSGVTMDTTPEAFSFATQADVSVATAVSSAPATITGIDAAAPVNIAGGLYSIDDGAFTDEDGTITAEQTIVVQVQSSDAFSTASTATLNISGVSADFTVTTEAQDISPEAFTFAAEDAVDYNTAIASMPVTITGINDATAVSITGGEYQIDAGEFTADAGMVTKNQTITVRVTSSPKAGQTTAATLTVGDQTGEFSVTTKPDTVAPEVAIQFPPPASMTEGETIYIRGDSVDVHGAIASLTVNGEAVTSDDDFATWSVELPLTEGENALTVTATDMAGNVNNEEMVSVRRAPITSAFPNDENPFNEPATACISTSDDRGMKIYVTDPDTNLEEAVTAILKVDLLSGSRSVLSDNLNSAGDTMLLPWGIHCGYDDRVYVTDIDAATVFSVDPISGARTVIASNSPGSSYITEPNGVALISVNGADRIYVADGEKVYWVDAEGGELHLVSSAELGIPNEMNPIGSAFSLVYDEAKSSLLIADNGSSKQVLSMDISSGARAIFSQGHYSSVVDLAIDYRDGRVLVADYRENKIVGLSLDGDSPHVLSSSDTPNDDNSTIEPYGVATHPDLGYVVVVDWLLKGLIAVDLVTGQRVIVSKSSS